MLRRRLLSDLLSVVAIVMGCSAQQRTDNSVAQGGGGALGGGAPVTGGMSAGLASGGATLLFGGGGTATVDSAGGTSAGAAPMQGGSIATQGGTAAISSGGSAAASSGGTSHSGGVIAGGAPNVAAGGSSGTNTGGNGAGGSVAMPAVRIVGRTALAAGGAIRFAWPGSAVHARFSGTQVSMDVDDGNNKNRFTVVVDGGAPKVVTTGAGADSVALAAGLAAGTHELLIWRNTEAAMGVTQFKGLSNFGGGSLLPPPAAPARRIEVIGDSLSVGAGNEGTSTNCSPNIDAFTNNYLGYASIAARSLQADLVTIAWSGIGVYRSYSASDPTMPARYDYAIPNDKTAWDFAKYQPHVVVINLGTNDFGSGNPGQAFVDAYVAFAKHVRSKYGAAPLVLVDMYGGDRLTALNSVVAALKSAGETKVDTLSFSSVPNNNTACNQHPNAAAHKAMGDLLTARLKSLLSW